MASEHLAAAFFDSAQTHAAKQALRWKEEGRWIGVSYAELAQKVEECARGLMALGITSGDYVCIYSPNRWEWAVSDLAILSIGAVTVPIYSTSTAETVRYIVDHCKPKLLFVASGFCASNAGRALIGLSGAPRMIAFDGGMELGFRDLARHGTVTSARDWQEKLTKVRPDSLATLIYTSGTTGDPKGVMLTHRNIHSNCVASLQAFPVTSEDSTLSFLPLSHALERMAGLHLMLMAGVTIHLAEDIAKVSENLLEVRPTILITVPRMLEKFYGRANEKIASRGALAKFLFDMARTCATRGTLRNLSDRLFFRRIREAMGGRLRLIVSGGAALSDEIARFFEAVGFHVLQGYGLTETSPVVSLNRLQKNKIGTVGPPISGVEVRVAEDGEILVRGPNVMKGYFRDERATAEAIDSEGWFHTGDIGELDDDTYLRITDRKKEIIVTSGGKNIAPQPIENDLKLDPLIDQACVIGDGHPFLVVLLVPNFETLERRARDADLSWEDRERLLLLPQVRSWFEQAIERLNAKHARYETLKRFALLWEPWTIERNEITPTLKLRRKVIQRNYAGRIERLYERSN